ncbi:MAG: hypothetical protein O7I42_26110 [Alphaproteobacteria bacterium]|nr:hypothetical protein [Alphaproteobacteria bacterium]
MSNDHEAQTAQSLGDQSGIIGRVGQEPDLRIPAIADDQGDALLGHGRPGERQGHQCDERDTSGDNSQHRLMVLRVATEAYNIH